MKQSRKQGGLWRGWEQINLPIPELALNDRDTHSAKAKQASTRKQQPIKRLRLLRHSQRLINPSKPAVQVQPRNSSTEEQQSLLVFFHGIDILPSIPGMPWGSIDCDRYEGIINLLLEQSPYSDHYQCKPPDILLVDYVNNLWGVGPQLATALSPAIGKAIESAETTRKQVNRAGYSNIVLMGHSFGSLLMRRVLVDAVDKNEPVQSKEIADQPWYQKVNGLIVLSGSNLGFKIAKPKGIVEKAGAVVLNLSEIIIPQFGSILVAFGIGRLVGMARRNSAWIVDTRILWLRNYEGDNKKLGSQQEIRTLYINGAQDQLVGDDDLAMVYQLGNYFRSYSIAKVRHADFMDIDSNRSRSMKLNTSTKELPEIRFDLQDLLSVNPNKAANSNTDSKQKTSEIERWTKIIRVSALHENNTDQGNDRTVVFLIHGIRDFAEWQEDIDYNVRSRYREKKQKELESSHANHFSGNSISQTEPATSAKDSDKQLQVIHVKYGYFNALQFIFPSERARAIRSFSDDFYQLMARFPDLKQENIHVFAHSNGTFVFGEALRRYSEIRVNRVLIAGSVLPCSFDWKQLVKHSSSSNDNNKTQIWQILNYAANKDWPTGLLCRGLGIIPGWRTGQKGLFSGKPAPLLGVGPGGTDGFKDFKNFPNSDKPTELLGWNFYLEGDHGASLRPGYDSASRIARYLIGFKPAADTWIDSRNTAYSSQDLDNNIHPLRLSQNRVHQASHKNVNVNNTLGQVPYPSLFRGLQGNLLAVVLLVAVIFLILWLFGIACLTINPLAITLMKPNPIFLHTGLLALTLYIVSRF